MPLKTARQLKSGVDTYFYTRLISMAQVSFLAEFFMNSDATQPSLGPPMYNHLHVVLVHKMYHIVGKRKNINGSNVYQDLQTPFFVTNNHHCFFCQGC